MKYWDIAKGELVDPDTPTLGEKFSITGMDKDLNIQTPVVNAKGGGLIRQKHAAGLAVPFISQTALRLLGTMGISAAAATKMAQENPTTFNTMLSNLLSGAGELAPSEVFKDKPEEEVERVQEVTQTDWKPSFKSEEPKPPMEEPPKVPDVLDLAETAMTAKEIIDLKEKL